MIGILSFFQGDEMGRKTTSGDIAACARCGEGFAAEDTVTRLYIAGDPDGALGLSGTFHDHCAVPVWAFAAPELKRPALQ